MGASLPKGFAIRPPSSADLEDIVSLLNACAMEYVGRPTWTIEELRRKMSAPGSVVAQDARVVTAPSGTPMAFFAFQDLEPHVALNAWGGVHPGYTRRGVGTALCQWLEQRARQCVARAPAGAQVCLYQTVWTGDQAAQALLRHHGYRLVGHWLRMDLELHEPLPVAALPEGILIRPLGGKDELPAFVEAVRDECRGHRGYPELPLDQDLQLWTLEVEADPDFDPSLWFVAVEGSQIVGTAICRPKTAEGPEIGYISNLGVRPAWRQRGIATALLHQCFAELLGRGKQIASLDVDAENPTGATRLYEKAGMRIERQSAVFELELRPGFDPATRPADSE